MPGMCRQQLEGGEKDENENNQAEKQVEMVTINHYYIIIFTTV